jgi:mevalonate kinase
MIQATAPGKVILFGEHAVVYGRPAIAAPVSQVRATAVITPSPDTDTHLIAPDLGLALTLAEADEENPLAAAVRQVETAVNQPLPPVTITVNSQIPIASGMGSGAAITAAIIRALAQHLDWPASQEWLSDLTYEVEKLHHGTPSGIDNTVVAYEQPVYFVRQQPQNRIEAFHVAQPLHLLIAGTGIRSSTKVAVGDVRRQWQAEPTRFEALFDGCGRIAEQARAAIERGDLTEIGRLMNQNHILLQEMTVSSPELDCLVTAANQAGALGAKMSGAGRGGNMIALVNEGETAVREALLAAGATAVLSSTIK